MGGKEKFTSSNLNGKRISENIVCNGLRWKRCKVFKNLSCTSLAGFLLFTAVKGLAYLQSTINSSEGMGVMTEGVAYGMFFFSALFLPKLIIRKLGCKLTMVLSTLAYFPLIVANLYPTWETLIPSSALAGVSASLLGPSIHTYLYKLAELYKDHIDRKSVASTATLLFGIFGTCFLLSDTSGNLLSYFVLKNQKPSSLNITKYQCGILFEENGTLQSNNTNLKEVDKDLRNTLIGIFICLSILSVLPIVLLLDPLPKDHLEANGHSLVKGLTATLRITKRKQQLLLMPLAFYYGMQDAFYVGDFTRAYIACSWDISHVSLISAYQGVLSGLFSTLSGWLQKYTGRIPFFVFAALSHILTFIQLFLWTPDPEKPHLFFIFVVMWGTFNGISAAQLKALYGHLLRGEEESAFANFYMGTSLGRSLSFSYSKYLAITTKLYLLISVFCFSQVGYVLLEWDVHKSATNEKVPILLKEAVKQNKYIEDG